ncbi:hypothetical protein [uncultured Cohaesibacter sp.]|uniref:hypothetical protein n=1 Tax=uncultured Cohaesibacter sp. TaxID=1002546 RepID=UPI0029C96FCE|nr:hypothetical protein [uncultured Cohaesibacter sp.]
MSEFSFFIFIVGLIAVAVWWIFGHLHIHQLSSGEYVVCKGHGWFSQMVDDTGMTWMAPEHKLKYAARFKTKGEAKTLLKKFKDFN